MRYPNIVANAELNLQLEREGYVVIDLLNATEVENLLGIYNDLGPLPDRFYSTTHVADKDMRVRVNRRIHGVLSEPFAKALHSDAKPLGAALLNKPPGNSGILPLHQDWNIVDETKTRSFNIWIPLTDVVEDNGAVRVLGGSHMIHQTYRGPNLGLELQDISAQVLPHLKTLPMSAGQALITDHAVWHASGPNNSTSHRKAVVVGCAEKGADIKFYYAEDGCVSEYDTDGDFYLYGNPLAGPEGLHLSRRIEYKVEQLGVDQFYQDFGVQPKQERLGLLSRLKQIFTA